MATTATKKKKTKNSDAKENAYSSYDRFKVHNGKIYTGMAIGRSHKWNYDSGVWRERKITPEQWELTYSVVKRRAGKAPEGSGVPVGTGYHWFILSHQFVEKLNANDYSTTMVGLKFKLAHKRASKGTWNISDEAKRKNLVKILRDLANQLEQEPENMEAVPIEFDYNKKHYEGEAVPVMSRCKEGICFELDVTLNKEHMGLIRNTENGWRMTAVKSQALVNRIGEQVEDWYG